MKGFFKENWLIVIVLLYVLSPLDFLPDVLPGIGQIDDATIVLIEILRRYSNWKKKDSGESGEVHDAEIIE